MDSLENYAQMKSELSALRGDINNLDGLVSRLDVAIDKISDVSTTISRLLAVHDSKIENHTRLIDQLAESADKRRSEADKRSQEILDKITQIREDMRNSIHTSNKELNEQIDTKLKDFKTEIEEVSQKVDTLHRFKWLVVGGGAIVVWIIGKLGWVISLAG